MDLKKLGRQAKSVVDKRGGSGALKEDAAELKNIARGSGSVTDKAKRAAAAIRDPGREGDDTEATAERPTPPAEAPPESGESAGRGRDGV